MVSTVENFHFLEVFSSTESDGVKVKPQDEKKTPKPKFAAITPESSDDAEGDGGFKYSCTFCNQKFKRKERLDRHIFSHTNEKTFQCDFESCSKAYANKSHLTRHRKSHEEKAEIASVTCEHPGCLQMFTNKSNMNRHYKTHHVNLFPHKCGQCVEKFRRKLQLKKHEIQVHTKAFPHTCPQCSKGFLNMPSYLKHLAIHRRENECPFCPATFPKWSLLVEHRRSVHRNDISFACDLCDKTFSRKCNIKQHLQIHIKKEAEIFQCHYEDCPKFFTANRNLTAHIKSKHLGTKWMCDHCKRELSSLQKLKQHVQAHLDPSRAKLLLKKRSTTSRVIGLDLPQSLENKIIRGEAAEITLPPPESSQESATEQSDF